MGKLLTKIRGLFAKILIIIAVILVALAIIYSGKPPVEIFGVALDTVSMSFLAALSLGLAFIVDADSASKTLASVTNGAKKVVETTGAILGQAVKTTGEVATTAITSFIWPIVIIGGGYLLLTRDLNDHK